MSGSVTATYRSMEGAREAMTALERAGIDSSRISLEGERPARAAAEHDTSRRDLRVTGQLGSRVLIGGALGAVAGGLVGWLVGSLVFDGFPAMLATVIAGVIAGSVMGGALSGYGTPAMSEEWELTHQSEPPGQTRVRVTRPTRRSWTGPPACCERKTPSPSTAERFDPGRHQGACWSTTDLQEELGC